ncbi:MAG TPA: hypothetical protein PLD79_09835 [Halothiobacillus sp.]|nr:hypothetical protein [Halothiobacillus sp.]
MLQHLVTAILRTPLSAACRFHLSVGEIETEGLAIMPKDMGAECWGLPDVEIIHAED